MIEGIRSHRLEMFCFLLLAVTVVVAGGDGLYSDEDNVVILDHTNFHSTISAREHAWLVEFYASWCGYCRGFAPVFKSFAAEVAGWEVLEGRWWRSRGRSPLLWLQVLLPLCLTCKCGLPIIHILNLNSFSLKVCNASHRTCFLAS